ncbi:MAG: right-handed parallel beta-helix repeat-containing protein [Deinococcales bacterium]
MPLLVGVLAVLQACAPSVASPSPIDWPLWTGADVGDVQLPGRVQPAGTRSMLVTAAGQDIWGTADHFYFVYQRYLGDVDVRARVDRLQRTESWAKAGVMVRAGLASNAVHVYMGVTPDGAAEFISRSETGGVSSSSIVYDIALPAWVRIVREGATLTGYVAGAGHDWTKVGSMQLALASEATVGLAVTSQDPTRPTQALVSGLSATHPSSAAPLSLLPGGGWDAWVCGEQPLSPAYAPTLFVSTAGSDANDGRDVEHPLRTLARAALLAKAGDVVWIRGGAYDEALELTHSGRPGAPIVFESYPGECAVIDGAGRAGAPNVKLSDVSYNVLRNLTVRGSPDNGVLVTGAGHNVVSNIHVYGSVYSGIANVGSSDNLFQYIVSHDNFDAPDGNDADGISISSGDGNRVRYCVVYDNSDDGVDTWRSTNSVVERCLSVRNGFQGGDGNGFKAGGAGATVHTVVRESVAYGNKTNGFDHNTGLDVRFDNDTAYANGGYGFIAAQGTLRNNLAVDNRAGALFGDDSGNVQLTNSWNLNLRGSPFATTDATSPSFLSLADGGPAVDVGSNIGLPYAGAAPDLGALPLGQTLESVLGVSLIRALTP